MHNRCSCVKNVFFFSILSFYKNVFLNFYDSLNSLGSTSMVYGLSYDFSTFSTKQNILHVFHYFLNLL